MGQALNFLVFHVARMAQATPVKLPLIYAGRETTLEGDIMSKPAVWVRNMYTGPGGGAYTGPGGGMYTGLGGGAYTGPGGGMYSGPSGGAYTGPGGGLYTGPGGGAYTGPGGGLYSGPGGGLYTGPGGGLYTGPGGGMYTGPDSNPYSAITPPWPLMVGLLRTMKMNAEAEAVAQALARIGWRG